MTPSSSIPKESRTLYSFTPPFASRLHLPRAFLLLVKEQEYWQGDEYPLLVIESLHLTQKTFSATLSTDLPPHSPRVTHAGHPQISGKLH